MAKRLEGKVAVVTGGGRGIGRSEALAFAAEGARVVVNAPSSSSDDVVGEIKRLGGEAVANHDSVVTAEGGENIIRTAIDSFGRIDILVNNAGVVIDRMIFNMTEEEWDTVLKVHLYGTFYCTKPACVYFRQQRSGRIINTSSAAGLGNGIGRVNYGTAKEGIIGFTRTVAMDMGKYGVTCNAIRPRAGTGMTSAPGLKEAWEKAKAKGLPTVGTEITPEEMEKITPDMVAPLVVYLASDEAASINGRTFWIIGGEIGLYSEPEVVRSIYKDGAWTLDELVDIMPKSLSKGLVNPAPPQLPK